MKTAEMKCDFCAAPAEWRYDTDDQYIAATTARGEPMAVMHSTDGWAACDMCRRLIDNREPDMLAAYSAARGLTNAAIDFAAAKRMNRIIQRAFWEAKRGPAIRLEARSAP